MNNFKPVRKAVIPVAGYGTRFLPASKAIPKELLPLVDKPVVQYIVEEAVSAGISEIVFIISENKTAIEKHFSQDLLLEDFLEKKGKKEALATIQKASNLAKFVFIPQHEPLGLGHAILQARDVIGDEPFMVFGGDDVMESDIPAAEQLIEVYHQYGGSVLGVIQATTETIGRYGAVDIKEELSSGVFSLKGIVEKPPFGQAPSNYGSVARWLLMPQIFDELTKIQPDSHCGEIQLQPAIASLISQQEVYAKLYQGIYRDCGNVVEYLKANLAFSLKHREFKKEIYAFIQEIKTK